jgi:hypothetical protein
MVSNPITTCAIAEASVKTDKVVRQGIRVHQ